MNINIIVHSKTGNTNYVAEKLNNKILEKNIKVNLFRFLYEIKNINGNKIVEFKNNPEINKYDLIIFCSPVEAFSLPSEMQEYLKNIYSLENKKIILLITHFFPYEWMGGNRTIKQMSNFCKIKKGEVIHSEIINWSRKDRNIQIENAINKILNLL